VKGRTEPVMTYEVKGLKEGIPVSSRRPANEEARKS
jgi:hypothetical protein